MVIHGRIITEAFRLGQKGFRQLYRAVNYQDKLIDRAWSRARIAKPIRMGVRHGAAGGAIAGIGIEELKNKFGDDTVNGISQIPTKRTKTGTQYKARYRRAKCPSSRYSDKQRGNYRR